ncbi:MAG: hypothetical protein J6O56_03250, partial [Bacilli bacterium]|nr:hypothetical protein [Bacilli bacterium]
YNSCKEIGEEYKYEKDYICYKTSLTCESYYSIENDQMKCISYQDCLKEYKYIKGKQCVKDCDPNDYKSEYILNNNQEIETIGGCYSEPNDCINEGLIFFNKTERVCRRTCNAYKISETAPIKNENGETCFSSCPSNYPYKDATKLLCLEKCEKYYYGNDCLDNCQNKYHFEDSKECLDSCKIDNKYYYEIKDSTDKICYYSCPSGYPYVESATFNQKESYKCLENCPTGKYYYEDKKICRDSCDILYKSENDNICVTQCSPDEKVKNEKYCIDSCPSNTPYILKEKLSNLNSIIVDKCVSICPSGYPLISDSTNYCLKECPFSESYQYNGRCYKKCKANTYADEISKICFDNGCPSDFKYYEVDDEGVKICKISCPKDAYISQEGQCLKECPSDQNYIGGTNLCLKKCSNDYGEYYEEFKKLDNYNIYRCLHSCSELTVYDTKECVSKENKCPTDYYESPNNVCYKECNLDENYPFSTKDDGDKKVCAKKCHESQGNYYKDNKKCTNGCLESDIIDYDGACVLKCTNIYYNYIENGTCVNKCSEKKFIKDYKCIDECPTYSYIEEKECRNECDSNHFSKEIMKDGVGTKVYKCVTKCDEEDFYYETGSYSKRCLSSCNERDFIIQDTQICTSNCPNNYKSYFYSGMSIETYKDNTCVLNCPSDKPYVFSGKCLEECPTGNKFHIQGQVNCIPNCPKNSKIVDGNECTSFCPNDKFLAHDNKTCINNCSDTSYKYYIEGINNCLEKCDQDYFIEDYKCVKSCSENKPYL